MAVNDNDRVTSRRLKQFWDLAKPWIQTLVSGAIDTSEAAMESSMDTKILAAKPNYLMPNVDDQIGAGFGYNDVVGNYKSSSGYIGFSGLATYFSGTATEAPFKGNDLIGKQAAYLFSLYGSTNNDMIEFAKTFLKGFEGKLVAFSKTMSADANFTSYIDFINDLDNFKSTYIEEEACLLSPVWTVGENTYQTKLYKRSGNYNQFAYSLSVNGGAFEEQTPASGDGLAWCASFNNMPLDIGSCDVPDGSVTTTKIANSAVTLDKIAQNARQYIGTKSHKIRLSLDLSVNNTSISDFIYLSSRQRNTASPTTTSITGIFVETYGEALFYDNTESGSSTVVPKHMTISNDEIVVDLTRTNAGGVLLQADTNTYSCCVIQVKNGNDIYTSYAKVGYKSYNAFKIVPFDSSILQQISETSRVLIYGSFDPYGF